MFLLLITSQCDIWAGMSTTLIERLNEIIATGEVSRAGLARAAGLHPNSLRKLGAPDWNPTADTLGRLEKLIQRGSAEVLVGPEEIINEARNGRMFILVDDESRENEGDLIIPAQMATPDAVNFMARHGRGPHLPRADQGTRRPARPRADDPHQPQPQRDRLHRLDRGEGGDHHRHQRRRPRAHHRRRHRCRATAPRRSSRPAMSSR